MNAVDWSPTGRADATDRRVLLVHGLGANTLSWTPFGQAVADALDATVTAIDLVGFGRTRAPERTATIATNRDLVTAVLRRLGPSIVFGNSMGAVIGTGVTARHPELVEALVLVNPALRWGRIGPGDLWRVAKISPLLLPPVGRRVIRTRAQLLGPRRVVDATLSVTLHEPTRLDPELRRRFVLLAAERYAYPEAASAYADAAHSLYRELAGGAFDRDLASASRARPTLLVHGVEDRLVASDLAREAGKRHLDVSVELLEGIGHAPQLEAPEQLLEVTTAWLAGAVGPDDAGDGRMGSWRRHPVGATRAAPAGSSESPSASSSTS